MDKEVVAHRKEILTADLPASQRSAELAYVEARCSSCIPSGSRAHAPGSLEPPPEANEPPDVVWQCLRPVYGLGDAPNWWSTDVAMTCEKTNGMCLLGDKCTWLFRRKKNKYDKKTAKWNVDIEIWGWISYHVDDFKCSSALEDHGKLDLTLLNAYEMGPEEMY